MAVLAVDPTSADGPRKQSMSRVLRADFGDGYSQRAGDGINVISEIWDVEWEHLDSDEISNLETQLEAARGVDVIDWTPPDETVAQKFTVAEWQKTMKIGNVGIARSVTAIFRREFDLG